MSNEQDQALRISFVITSLNAGGAEQMLIKLVSHISRQTQCQVISLRGHGALRQRLIDLNIPLVELNFANPLMLPIQFFRLCKELSKFKPNVIQTWLYHADFFGGLAGVLLKRPVIWNVRSDKVGSNISALPTRTLVRVLGVLSKVIPKKIIFCSQRAMQNHFKIGYPRNISVWIPNGFYLPQFKTCQDIRKKMRESLRLYPDDFVVGTVGRLDPLKDYGTFFAAAKSAMDKGLNCRFVMVGRELTKDNSQVKVWLEKFSHDQRQRFELLGYRENVSEIMQAFDVFTLTSTSEGFPNVLGEAMACEIPCVSTDVGDASEIIGQTGFIVAAKDNEGLAKAWSFLNSDSTNRKTLGTSARQRVTQLFDIEKVADVYLQSYKKITELA